MLANINTFKHMPFEKGNKLGGRKTIAEEQIKTAVINKCWDFLLKKMSNNTSDDNKTKIALNIVPKTIKQDVGLEASLTINDLLKYGHNNNKESEPVEQRMEDR